MTPLTQLADAAEQYKKQYESGELTADEFKELVEDLNIVKNIGSVASELETDIIARQVLLGVIALTKTVSSCLFYNHYLPM